MTDGARPSPRQVIDAVSVNAASTHAGCRSMRRHGSPKGLSLLDLWHRGGGRPIAVIRHFSRDPSREPR